MPQEITPPLSAAFVCSRGTLDGAYPPLILAVNTVRQGGAASIFYTFTGINVLRRGFAAKLAFYPPGFLGAVPGVSTLASWVMRRKINKAGIPDVATLLETAQLEGVRLVACKMTMDMLGLPLKDLVDDITIMTAEEYIGIAGESRINMFT